MPVGTQRFRGTTGCDRLNHVKGKLPFERGNMGSKYGASLAEARPELLPEWSRRNPTSAEDVKPGTTRKFWWECARGHEWEAAVDNRVYGGTGCPFCATGPGSKPNAGVTDLATRRPDLAAEWASRNEITPQEVTPGMNRRAWWECATCGHEWEAVIKVRAGRGTGCPACRGRLRGLQVSGPLEDPELEQEWSPRNALKIGDYPPGSKFNAWWVCSKGHEYQAPIHGRVKKRTQCRRCGFGGSSAQEGEIEQFVQSLGVGVRRHHKQIAPGYEYDVTVPDRKVAIEFNGVYWHSEEFKPRDYHALKTRAAQDAGWQLIHVWEDDWVSRRRIVERMIARKLGVSTEPRFNARSLKVQEVTFAEARTFLEENHIQGFTVATHYVALESGTGIQALLTLKKTTTTGTYRLERFATSGVVRGGFSKLLKAAIRISGAETIVTFADKGVSDGGLYAQHGFENDGEILPDYTYLAKGRRVHKFNYRKKRFKNDPKLKFKEGLTERELAELNGLRRVYDAGKVRWVLHT